MLQAVELGLPELLDAPDPLLEFSESRAVDAVDAALRVGADRHQAGFPQNFEMLRDGRRADLKTQRDFPGGQVALSQQLDDLAARRVGESGEGEHRCIIARPLK